MLTTTKAKLLNRYLPFALSALLLVAAFGVYLTLRQQTPEAQASWYTSGSGTWNYRKVLTINYNYIASSTAETYATFPVLVNITDSDLAAHASSTGADILFTLSDGQTKLNHEIETYNSTTGQLIAWVNVGSSGLSTSTNTSLYMYYGNSSATSQQNATSTWGSGYGGVWHLGSNVATNPYDSTSNANNGTSTHVTATTGQIDGAANFATSSSAVANNINLGSASSVRPGHTGTVSVWFYVNVLTSYGEPIATSPNTPGTYSKGYGMAYYSNGNYPYFAISNGTTANQVTLASSISTGKWYYAVCTWDGTTVTAYLNGALATGFGGSYYATTTQTIDPSYGYPLELGASGNLSAFDFVNGVIDEARVSSIARSADWIKTEYNNQLSPSMFLSEGLVQNNPSGTAAPVERGVTIKNSKVIIQNAKVRIQAR